MRSSVKREELSEGPKAAIIDKTSKEKRKGPIKGVLGFDEDMDQESLMAEAFGDAGAEQEFAESKAEVEKREEEEYKKEHHIDDPLDMEGWGNWAGIVRVMSEYED